MKFKKTTNKIFQSRLVLTQEITLANFSQLYNNFWALKAALNIPGLILANELFKKR